MSFASPLWLFALLAVPAIVAAYVVARRRARRYAIRHPAASTLALAAGASPTWRRHVPVALLLASIAALAVALARPRATYHTAVNQASLMLVTDHSGSMSANDVAPNRLVAAQQAADTFLDKIPGTVKVGAIAFGSSPDASQAPVSDKSAARAIIDGQAAGGSTATGDALQLALQLLHGANAHHPPSAMILLSDGAANSGVDVVGIARQAGHEHIPIYTVALGTPNGVLQNPDPLAPPVPVPPDPQLMAQIAKASGGRTFSVQSADVLSSIYRGLATQLGTVTRTREVTAWFVAAGVVLLLAAAGVAVRRSGRLP